MSSGHVQFDRRSAPLTAHPYTLPALPGELPHPRQMPSGERVVLCLFSPRAARSIRPPPWGSMGPPEAFAMSKPKGWRAFQARGWGKLPGGLLLSFGAYENVGKVVHRGSGG